MCWEGLWTTEQPAARAGAIFTELSAIGKLNGVMIPTVPTGSRRIRAIPWSRWRVDPSRSDREGRVVVEPLGRGFDVAPGVVERLARVGALEQRQHLRLLGDRGRNLAQHPRPFE